MSTTYSATAYGVPFYSGDHLYVPDQLVYDQKNTVTEFVTIATGTGDLPRGYVGHYDAANQTFAATGAGNAVLAQPYTDAGVDSQGVVFVAGELNSNSLIFAGASAGQFYYGASYGATPVGAWVTALAAAKLTLLPSIRIKAAIPANLPGA